MRGAPYIMKISTRGRYGLRIMTELAMQYGRGPVLVASIAKNQGISGKYIHVLTTALKSAGLLRASRGPRGGYELAQSPDKITALEVVTALEGRCAPVDCVVSPGTCPREETCVTNEVWREIAAAVEWVLGRYNLAELAARQQDKTSRGENYEI